MPIALRNFYCRAGSFQLGSGLFGLVLADTFLDRLRSAVDQFLGFLEAKTGDCTNSFDHVNFLVASSVENDIEFVLLFCGFTTGITTCGCRGCGRAGG